MQFSAGARGINARLRILCVGNSSLLYNGSRISSRPPCADHTPPGGPPRSRRDQPEALTADGSKPP